MTRSARFALVLALSALPTSARADEPPPAPHRPFDVAPDTRLPSKRSPAAAPIETRLDYARASGAEACPDEEALRSAVGAILGRDPFVPIAPRRLVAHIAREGHGFVARLEVREDGGSVSWAHPPIPGFDCRGLVRAMATAISVHVDPAPAPPGVPASQPTVIVVAPAPTEAPQPPQPDRPHLPPTQPSPHDGAKLRVGLGGAVEVGTMPAAAPALSMQLGARWRLASISGEGRFLLPVTSDLGPQGVQARTWAGGGSLVPCGHIPLPLDKWNVALCGLLTVGAVHAEGVDLGAGYRAGAGSTLYAAAGARLSLEFPVGGPVLLRVTGDVLGGLRPARLQINDKDDLWTGARLTGALGGGVVADFF
jgi:hypothetical protein